jgi:hypothetical protein
MPLTNEYWAVQRLEATSDCRSPLAHAWLAYLSVSSLSELSLPVLGKQLGCAGKDLRELSLVLGALSRVRVNGPQPEIEARLIEVSTTKRQRPHIVALAVGALGAVGGSAADEHLRKIAASTGDGRIANAAVLAIARIEKTAATPFLLEYAKKHPDQRSGVVSALIEEGDDRALPTLAEWLATASGTTAAHLKEAIVAVKKRPADLQRELAEEEIEPH